VVLKVLMIIRVVFTSVSKRYWFCNLYASGLAENVCANLSANQKKTQNQWWLARTRFSALRLVSVTWSYFEFVHVLCDWLEWLLLFLVLRHSIENHSIRDTGCLVTAWNLFELFFWVIKDNVILARNFSVEQIILPLEDNRRIIEMTDLSFLYFIKNQLKLDCHLEEIIGM